MPRLAGVENRVVSEFAGREVAHIAADLNPASVTSFARKHRMTEFALFLSAFSVTVARFSNSDRFVLATPVSRRERPEQFRVVGLMVNTVPIIMDLRGNPTIGEVLRRTRAASLAALRRRAVPFHVLSSRLGVSGTGIQTVFNVMFGLDAVTGRLRLAGAQVAEASTPVTAAPFGLDVLVNSDSDHFKFKSIYSTRNFREQDVARLLSAFQRITCQVTADTPERRISDLVLPKQRASRRVAGSGRDAPAGRIEPSLLLRASCLADVLGFPAARTEPRVGLLAADDAEVAAGMLGNLAGRPRLRSAGPA